MVVVKRLLWEDYNIEHIARHNVTPAEVEQVCHGQHITLEGHSGRLVVVGKTENGRMLAAILDPEQQDGFYYVATARPASSKERRYFETLKGGEQAA